VLGAAEGGNVPTYQYACTDCGDRSEVVQRFTDDPLTVCTVCDGKLRKVYSPVGIVFKGSGFYRTDSRDSSKSAASSAGGSNGSGSSPAAASAEKSGSSDGGASASAESSGSKSSDSSSGDGKKTSKVAAGTTG
jgi:putative FmdB family regulatory protein